jgi:hypothetical protein
MTEDEPAPQPADLPDGIKFVPASLECVYCRRRWRYWPGAGLSDLNREHLIEHVIGHVRVQRRRPAQRWRR